jgi:hypothetical protein
MPSVIELKRPLDCKPKLIHPTFKAAFIAKGLIPSAPMVTSIPLKPVPKLSSLFPAFIVNLEE